MGGNSWNDSSDICITLYFVEIGGIMKELTEKEFLAMADELTEVETVDEYFTIYIRKTNEGVAFYKKWDDEYERSYYYLFEVKQNTFNLVGSNIGVQIYNETFNAK